MIDKDQDAGATKEKGDEDTDSDEEEVVCYVRCHQQHTLGFDLGESEDNQSGSTSKEEERKDSSD